MNTIKATLPIEFGADMYPKLDAVKAREFGEAIAGEYCFAEPFPHIVIDDFLPKELIDFLWDKFPPADTHSYANYVGNTFEHNKRAVSPYDCSGSTEGIFHFFNGAPFLQFIEGLTAIEGLIPDPHFDGGGFHEISRGGKLGIHADFRIQTKLHLHRRVNVLIYLNREWDSNWGGQLELWDRTMSERVRGVEPLFNRCVIFNTDADAYHGHPDPLNTPADVTRKSLALYYYTASKAVYVEAENVTTIFKARPSDTMAVRLAAQKQNKVQYLKLSEWMPPLLYRTLRGWKRKINR